jgi:pyruvate kinase
MTNKTKIVVTIGPSSNSKPILKKMILSGMNVARLNFSHGSYKDHGRVINDIRSLSKELDKPVGIILDLQGPKIRTDTLKNGKSVLLKKNKTIQITSKQVPGNADIVSTTYKNLSKDTQKGDKILIDDGLIELKVLSKTMDTVTCKIISGGRLKEHKGINLPGVKVSAPSLTKKDKKDLLFGLKKDVDFFALSFVRDANDLKHIKKIIKLNGSDTPVIAKIEKPEAVGNLNKILKIADGIMVARGDLGVEMKPEKVPHIQKKIIAKSIMANKPVITATQMLETMTDRPIPTRAEASDVANAIYDGTDAIMLSGETAVGKYPVEAVKMMTRIAAKTERSPFMKHNIQYEKDPHDPVIHAVAKACVNILYEVNAKMIVTFSITGKTSKLISKHRPLNPVYAFSPSKKIYNRLSLVWGVTPLLIPPINDAKGLIEAGEKIIISKKFAKLNDRIIIVTGLALKSGSTNLIKIHTIGKED